MTKFGALLLCVTALTNCSSIQEYKIELFPISQQQNSSEKGLLLHHLSERAVFGHKLMNDQSVYMAGFRIMPAKKNPKNKIFRDPQSIIDYYNSEMKLDNFNGIWITLAAQEMYSASEVQFRNQLIFLCNKNSIPVYVCDLSQPKDIWNKSRCLPINS